MIIPVSLRLSQTCLCGVVARKSLAERVHRCMCGLRVQRDVFAAYLARFVQTTDGPSGPSWWLDADQAKAAWPGAESHLPAASRPVSIPAFVAWARQQSASGRSSRSACLPSLHGEPERIAGKGGTMICESRDVVDHSVLATLVVESQAGRIGLSSEPQRSARGEETQEHPHRGPHPVSKSTSA